MLKNRRIMTVLAHPDDEALGCGGLLNKYSNQSIFCLIPVKRLEGHCRSALKILGVDNVVFGDFGDNRLDDVALADVSRFVENGIEKFNPDVIITHTHNCTNQDHRILYQASVIATRPNRKRIQLLSCEILSSTGYLRPTGFEPNYYVELSPDNLLKKMKAVEEYVTEARKCRSPEVVSALARVRGAESGYDYAEGYMIIRGYEED